MVYGRMNKVDDRYEQLLSKLPSTAICNAIGIGISITDTDFIILYQNDAHKTLFGSHAGEHCYTAYAKREDTCEICPLAKVYREGGIHTAEWIFNSWAGQIYFDVTASALMTKSGEVIAGIETYRNITNRKLMEARLRESEEHFRTIFDSSLVGIFFADSKGRLFQTNPSFRKMLGYSQDELIRSFMEIIHPDDAEESLKLFRSAVNGKVDNIKFEKRYLKKDGSIMWGDVSLTAINDPDGKFKYAIAIIEDTSERKNVEEKMQAAAVTDKLTGLFNRRGFFTLAEQQFKMADRLKKKMALLYLDLDNLKVINDELGHKIGDEALWDAVSIIKNSVRKADIIARIGGDEFAVLLTELSAPDTGEAVIRHIHNNIFRHNKEAGRSYRLSLSIGISRFDPHSPCSIDELLSRADTLMYMDKHKKRRGASISEIIERRKGRRFNAGGDCWAEIHGLGKVGIKDISSSGICLKTPQHLTAGKFHYINKICCNNLTAQAKGIAVWSSPVEKSNKPAHEIYDHFTALKFIGLNDSGRQSLEKISASLS